MSRAAERAKHPVRKVTLALFCACAVAPMATLSAAAPQTYDIVIQHGRVMDPESGLDAVRNIGIKGGVIRAITKSQLRGRRTLEANSLVVAPGFIDLHSHGQDDLTYALWAQDGVTTGLEMEVGVDPVPAWYAHRAGRPPVNYGATVSGMYCRALAFGAIELKDLASAEYGLPAKAYARDDWRRNPATAEQQEKINSCLQEGLDAGGLGLGFHLADMPGITKDELLGYFRMAARNHVPLHVHIRSPDSARPVDAAREIIEDSEKTGASAQICHVNSSGTTQTKPLVDEVAAAQARGVKVTMEVYPYTAAMTTIGSPHVNKDDMKRGGFSLHDIEWAATGERLTEETWDLYRRTQPNGPIIAYVMKDADVDYAVAHPDVMIASDQEPFENGKGHPRSAGTHARVLGRYVREKNALSLMQAIAKMTIMPAKRLQGMAPQMDRRGRIQVGMVADLAVFDPATVTDNATYQAPTRPSSGFRYVLVNGTPVIDDGRLVKDVHPGVAIRR